MLAVCAAGRILNPKSARSQVIGAMTMGAGAALMEELAVDKRFGFFVNHDLAGYEVPVHADIPHQEVVFLDEAEVNILALDPQKLAKALHNALSLIGEAEKPRLARAAFLGRYEISPGRGFPVFLYLLPKKRNDFDWQDTRHR